MFGNFNLNAGLSQLQDLGGRFQKIKEDLEQNIESSLRTNIGPSASGDEAGGVNAPADGVAAFGEWEGYSLPSPSTAKVPSAKQHEQDSYGASTFPTPSPLLDPAAAPEDSTQDLQQTPEGSVTNLQAVAEDTTTQPAADALQPDQQVFIAHDSTHEYRSASSQQEAQANTDQADVAAEQLLQAEAGTNQAGDSQASEQAQDAVSEAVDTSKHQPDSNGTTLAHAADETEQQHYPASEANDHAESSPAQSELDDAAQQVAEPTQQHEDQQEQLPVSSLYVANQVDQSSQRSLPDSAKSAADSRQRPASPSGQHEAASHNGTEAQHVNGITHEMQQEELEQQIGSQQSSQDSHEQQAAIPDLVQEKSEVEDMGKEAVWDMVQQLQAGLQAREKQLERQGEQLANMQEVQQQLQAKNEELVIKAAKVSEEDMAAVQAECERRLGAAERKVYALVKERDALRRGSDKLSSAHDLLKEKDSIISQVMEEGERLSIKQSNMETTIKKLRGQVKELEASHTQTAAKLAAEEAKIEAATQARQKAEAAAAAALQQHKAEAEQQKQHFGSLLKEAHKSQAVAEEKAAASAKEGLGKRVKEAEASAQALAESVDELRLTLDRQRASAELREEGLQREVRDLEQRCQAAEARHQDLAANIPEATRPLLRQLEAMQASASANAQAWAAAEASLTARLNESESAAAGAGEREKRAWQKLQAANMRMAATTAALDALRAELADANAEVERAQQAQRAASARCSKAEEQLRQACQAESSAHQRHIQLEHSLGEQLANEQAQSLEASLAAEERIQALEQRLASLQQGSTADHTAAGDPPAMAAPGYRWQLVRSSDKPSPSSHAPTAVAAPESSAASDKGSDVSYDTGPSNHHTRFQTGTAGELDRLRTALRQKDDQVVSLQSQLTNLEATRDSLAEEVIAAAGSEEAARSALADAASAEREHRQAQQQLMACTEMLGEKEERLEELRADLQDVKQLYKDQIEFMVEQLAHLTQQQKEKQQEVHENGLDQGTY